MDKVKRFDGIILPTFNISGDSGVGAVMGITQRELIYGPKEIRFNYAFPKKDELKNAGLFWLENCSDGAYSHRACNYWLLPLFSKINEVRNMVVRVRPTTSLEEDGTWSNYDFIFWFKGAPVARGHQYASGVRMDEILRQQGSLLRAVEVYERGEIDIKISKTLGEMKDIFEKITGRIRSFEITEPKRRLEVEARDAGWDSLEPLAAEVA